MTNETAQNPQSPLLRAADEQLQRFDSVLQGLRLTRVENGLVLDGIRSFANGLKTVIDSTDGEIRALREEVEKLRKELSAHVVADQTAQAAAKK